MSGPAPRGQLTREQWMARYGDQRGIASHIPPSLEDQFMASNGHLGQGMYGEVRPSSGDPAIAIKRQNALTYRLQREVDLQAFLGNELGLMPPIHATETRDMGVPNKSLSYIAMDNLRDQGYKTYYEMKQDMQSRAKGAPMPAEQDVFDRQIQAEQAINEAWAARAGIAMRDTHGNNVMVLPAGSDAADDGSRVKFVDAGMYEEIANPREQLEVQASRLAKAYESLGLGHMGDQFFDIATGLIKNGEVQTANNLINDALSDVEARRQALSPERLEQYNTANERMRFAGDIFKGRRGAPIVLASQTPATWE